MGLDYAQEKFRANPSVTSAADYLGELTDYFSDDMIGDDTFLDGVAEVRYWLKYQKLLIAAR